MSDSQSNLIHLLPPICRARGYRLYDQAGRRYVDLYQNGGSALLGHRAGKLTTELKNVISRGLIFNLPSMFQGRLVRELARLYPGFSSFEITGSFAQALIVVSQRIGRAISSADIRDPATQEPGFVEFRKAFSSLPSRRVPGSGASAAACAAFPGWRRPCGHMF